MNAEAAVELSGFRKMSSTFSEISNFHLNVATEFTIITSLGKWLHFLTIISSKNIPPISVCICPLPLFYCSLDFLNLKSIFLPRQVPFKALFDLELCLNLNSPRLLVLLLIAFVSYKHPLLVLRIQGFSHHFTHRTQFLYNM